MTDGTAPNFGGNYPMGGERLAPAWQAAWDTLGNGRYHAVEDLIDVMAIGTTPLTERTRMNLLHAARRAGLLEVRYRKGGEPVRRRVHSFRKAKKITEKEQGNHAFAVRRAADPVRGTASS